MKRLVLCAVLLSAGMSFAGDLSPAKAAQIKNDREKAMADIAKKYDGKKGKNDQKARAAEENAAEQSVLSKHGVSAKEWGRYDATQSRAERAETEKATADLKKKDEAAAKNAKKDGPKELVIQKGFSEENPTVMDEKEGAPPMVEKGLPKDGK
jgi:hypothetical protein